MIKIEKGTVNVYEDLGLTDAAEMQVKATLPDAQNSVRALLPKSSS
jgi:hypothetical protein